MGVLLLFINLINAMNIWCLVEDRRSELASWNKAFCPRCSCSIKPGRKFLVDRTTLESTLTLPQLLCETDSFTPLGGNVIFEVKSLHANEFFPKEDFTLEIIKPQSPTYDQLKSFCQRFISHHEVLEVIGIRNFHFQQQESSFVEIRCRRAKNYFELLLPQFVGDPGMLRETDQSERGNSKANLRHSPSPGASPRGKRE